MYDVTNILNTKFVFRTKTINITNQFYVWFFLRKKCSLVFYL